MLPSMIDVHRLVETIRTSPATKGWKLATGRGKRFLEATWTELVRRIEAWKLTQSQGGPTGAPAPTVSEQAQAPGGS